MKEKIFIGGKEKMKAIEDVISSLKVVEKGMEGKVNELEVAQVLSTLLFEANKIFQDKLVEVRDYETIKTKGAFKYAGQADTMYKEGFMPDDVYRELKGLGIDRHIGPSYLRVKGLLTHQSIRTFFGRQMAFKIKEYLNMNSPLMKDGYIVCIPNMTGGVWIGDETRRQLEGILSEYKVWSATPYARETRKPIYLVSKESRFVDYVEGLVPSPDETSVIFCFEELRTSAETSQNATNIYRNFGYNEIYSGTKIVEVCVFDYGHPVGIERLKRLGVDRLFLVDGKIFFGESEELDYISDSQYQTAIDWLCDPWKFTRRVLPDIKRLMKK